MNTVALLEGLPWIDALGWTLVHFLWQGAIVGVVFALLRASIPKRQCSARYVNGLVALLALAVLPVATFLTLRARHVPLPAETNPSLEVALAHVHTVGATVATTATAIEAVLPWIVLAWLIGVALVALRSWRQWRALVQVARKWATPDVHLQALVASLAQRFGFARHIRVLVSDRIDTPTLIGWIKPLILLPTAVALGLPRQQIELILAHELGHLRRYDHLVNLAQAVLETVLFYHPVVHWIAREVRNEREICCDELVLKVTRGEPREYATALAALEEMRQAPVRVALAASGGVLLERVRRILFAPHPTTSRIGVRVWLPLLTMLIVVLTAAVRMDRADPVYVDVPSLLPMGASVSRAISPATRDLRTEILRPRFVVADPPAPTLAPEKVAPASTPIASMDRTATPHIKPEAVIASSVSVSVPVATTSPSVAAEASPLPPAEATPLALTETSVSETEVDKASMATSVAPRKAPVPTRTIAPEYPDSARMDEEVRVQLNFTIAANGRVRDIKLNEGSAADTAFVRAATRALSQWRFSAASVDTSAGAHYRQDFVFAPQAQVEDGCVRRTGSLLCRRVEGDQAQVADAAGNDGRDLMAASQVGSH